MEPLEYLKKNPPKSIVILRALQLGDTLCAIPALRALRAALPGARLTLAGLPWAASLVSRFSAYLDDFIEFPGFPGLPERKPLIGRFPAFLEDVQSRAFDLALQMHGSGSISNQLVALFGAKTMAGYCDGITYCPEDGWFMPYPEGEPEVWRHLRLMEFLGIPAQGDALEFPLLPADEVEYHRFEAEYGFKPGGYVVLHAGARKAYRRWSVDRFADVGQALASRGLGIVLTGSAEEKSLADELNARLQGLAVNLAGLTSLGGLGALLSSSALLISNDTGVAHLADALNVPSVVLFTADDYDRWAPLNRQLHRVLTGAADCSPTDVLRVANELLAKEGDYAHD